MAKYTACQAGMPSRLNKTDILTTPIYTVSQKNDSDAAHYNFNAHQPILVIFGRDIADRICY